MLKIIMLRGLPASGKSTWAKQTVKENPHQYKRINKDDLRAMLDSGKHSKSNEKFVLKLRDWVIREALLNGKSVIVDDTNFYPNHEKRLRELAKLHEAETGKVVQFKIKEFDISVEECIRRDLERPNSVGEAVIRRMYNDWKNPTLKGTKKAVIPYCQQDKSLPHAVICDIDGTLAMMNGRSPFDMNRVGEDLPNMPVIELVRDLAEKYTIILLSGREDNGRERTQQWLENHKVPYNILLMRQTKDQRKDAIIKQEIVKKHILGKYYIRFVLDDRNQVVDMWRKNLQLPCFQVFYGDF